MARKKSHLNRAREDMKKLGIYRPEYEHLIGVYAQLCDQYDILSKRFTDSQYKIDEATGSGTKKAPIITTLESLRKDMLAYATQLGLTPHGDGKTGKKRPSALAAALRDLQ